MVPAGRQWAIPICRHMGVSEAELLTAQGWAFAKWGVSAASWAVSSQQDLTQCLVPGRVDTCTGASAGRQAPRTLQQKSKGTTMH